MPKTVQVKRPDVVEDAHALAALTGLSITDAIGKALKAQLAVERLKASARLLKRRARAEQALAELKRLPVVGPTLKDRDLYDSEGFPK